MIEPICLLAGYVTDVAEHHSKGCGEEQRRTSESSTRPRATKHTALNRLFHMARATTATDGYSYCYELKKSAVVI